MKKLFIITLLVFAAILVCSCHTVSTVSVSKEGRLAPEGMRIWSRPIEIGFQVSGTIEGNADNKTYKSVESYIAKNSKLNFYLFSKNSAIDVDKLSPLAKLAAFNAIKNANVDGMLVTMVKETKDGGKETAWVKGIGLKLVIYDEVSAERSDAFRYCQVSCEHGNCQGCIRINSSNIPDINKDVPVPAESKE